MNIRHWLTAQEALSLIWRSAGVVVAAATGLVAIKVFLSTHPEQAPGLIAMVGWLGFLPLLQLGLGRPVYSALRRRFVARQPVGLAVRRALSWFGALALLAVAAHAALGTWIVIRQGPSVGWAEVGLFAAGLAANGTATFQRDLAYALSQEDRYERTELLRRLIVLGCYGALWAGAPMAAVGVALVASGLASQAATAREASTAHPVVPEAEDRPFQGLGPDARRYLLFSFNELLLYNLPLVVFTLAAAGPELVYLGIWMRLFQLAVLPMRMLVDARVNRQTAAWFGGDTSLLRRELTLSLGLGSAAMGAALAVLAGAATPLVGWLGAPTMAADHWLLAGLALWGAGNVVQHVYGSFTLSHGRGFGFALKTSLGAAAGAGAVFLAARGSGLEIGASLAAMGGAYLLSAFAYQVHVQRLLALGAGAAR